MVSREHKEFQRIFHLNVHPERSKVFQKDIWLLLSYTQGKTALYLLGQPPHMANSSWSCPYDLERLYVISKLFQIGWSLGTIVVVTALPALSCMECDLLEDRMVHWSLPYPWHRAGK